MRAAPLLLLVIPVCVGAYWNDYMASKPLRTHETLSTIDDNRIQCKAINDEIQRIILLQRATDDPSEHWALEQRFMDLIKREDYLKRDQFNLMRTFVKDNRK
jgi:hypothetical protein